MTLLRKLTPGAGTTASQPPRSHLWRPLPPASPRTTRRNFLAGTGLGTGLALLAGSEQGKVIAQTAASDAAPAAAALVRELKHTAAREKQQLAASMDAVAQRWRSLAAENQWPTHPATPVEAVAGIAEQTRPGSNPVAPEAVPGRSEKAGTAPASEDVKTGVQRTPPGVSAEAPEKAPIQ